MTPEDNKKILQFVCGCFMKQVRISTRRKYTEEVFSARNTNLSTKTKNYSRFHIC
jgi:hypothetical protein